MLAHKPIYSYMCMHIYARARVCVCACVLCFINIKRNIGKRPGREGINDINIMEKQCLYKSCGES